VASTSVRSAQGPDFFEELGLAGISAEEKIKLLQKVELSAREQVISLILEKLGEKDCLDLSDLIKNGAEESVILVFLRERIPDLEILVTARIEKFKEELVSQVRSIQTDLRQLEDAGTPSVIPVDKKKAREELRHLEKESNRALVAGRFDQLQQLHERIRALKTVLSQ